MITYTNAVNPGNFVAPSAPITIFTIDKTIKYLRVQNNSPYHVAVSLDGLLTNITEFWQKDIAVPANFQGNCVITPTVVITSASHSQASQLTVQGLNASDGGGGLDSAIPQQAVTATATGKPIFSATVGFGSTTTDAQWLNIFNPANSGVVATFHSGRVYTNDSTGPTANMQFLYGADINFANAVSAVSHSDTPNPPVSVMHCTSADTVVGAPGSNATPETMNMQQGVTQEFLTFPDVEILYPGNNLYIGLSSGTTGHVVRLTLKWTEDTIVPPIPISGGVNVATQIDNSSLSPLAPVGTNLIKSVVPGPLTPVQLFNDGTGFYSVDQSGTLHRVFTFNSAGNPLQLGQAGDTLEHLGQSLFDQLLTAALGITNSGVLTQNSGNQQNTAGSVSGSVQFYAPIWGTGLKILIVTLNAWDSATIATFNLPSGITFGWFFSSYGSAVANTWDLFIGGTAQLVRHVLTLGAAGAAGTDEAVTAVKSDNIGAFALTGGAATSIQIGTTGGAANSGVIVLVGV